MTSTSEDAAAPGITAEPSNVTAESLGVTAESLGVTAEIPGITIESLDAAVGLLGAAGDGLTQAHWSVSRRGRYLRTRLAVLRAAAAVLAVRGTRAEQSGRPTSIWTVLVGVAPELTEWADYFEAMLPEGDSPQRVPASGRVVDDVLRGGEEFTRVVARTLGLPPVAVVADLAPLTAP